MRSFIVVENVRLPKRRACDGGCEGVTCRLLRARDVSLPFLAASLRSPLATKFVAKRFSYEPVERAAAF